MKITRNELDAMYRTLDRLQIAGDYAELLQAAHYAIAAIRNDADATAQSRNAMNAGQRARIFFPKILSGRTLGYGGS